MVSRGGRTIARYRYDYRGLRWQKVTMDGTTGFTYDPSGHLISQQTREGRDEGQRDYLWTDTAPIARIDGPLGQAKVHKNWLPQALMGFLHRHEREERGHATPLYYFHTDAMGTPRLATDAKQHVVWRWNEDAFGATVAAEQDRHGHRDHDRDHGSHDIDVNLRYPGQYYDSETGLFYNWNRYYNPNTGRYSRSDPIGLDGGLNTFGYTWGNPLKFTDDLGMSVHGFWADAPRFNLTSEGIDHIQFAAPKISNWWGYIDMFGVTGHAIGYINIDVNCKSDCGEVWEVHHRIDVAAQGTFQWGPFNIWGMAAGAATRNAKLALGVNFLIGASRSLQMEYHFLEVAQNKAGSIISQILSKGPTAICLGSM